MSSGLGLRRPGDIRAGLAAPDAKQYRPLPLTRGGFRDSTIPLVDQTMAGCMGKRDLRLIEEPSGGGQARSIPGKAKRPFRLLWTGVTDAVG